MIGFSIKWRNRYAFYTPTSSPACGRRAKRSRNQMQIEKSTGNETKRNETKRNETRQNGVEWNEGRRRFASSPGPSPSVARRSGTAQSSIGTPLQSPPAADNHREKTIVRVVLLFECFPDVFLLSRACLGKLIHHAYIYYKWAKTPKRKPQNTKHKTQNTKLTPEAPLPARLRKSRPNSFVQSSTQ
jgi:hypothetical protein